MKRIPTYKRAEDLSGRRIGVCVGVTFEEYLKGTLEMPGGGFEYRILVRKSSGYENEDPAIQDLALGGGTKLDAVITLLAYCETGIDSGKPVRSSVSRCLFAYASLFWTASSTRDVSSLLK